MHLWDRLLPKAERTLNFLRTSRLHPQLSAATHYHGQQDIFCSTMMQNHRPRETRKAANLGSSRAQILTWSHHASLPVSKCIPLDNGQRPHRGYSRIHSPQLSNATVIIHRPVTNGSQRHAGCFAESTSRRPIRQRRG
jgi:hypothetical protein